MCRQLSFLLVLICSVHQTSYAQFAGSRVYGASNGRSEALESIHTTDSTLIVSAKVLLNKEADFYLITFGVVQEAKTPREAFQNINERIDKFTSGLKKFGVRKEDYYIDFIAQAKLYDYKIEGNMSKQFESGFEVKKNIILRTSSLDSFDQLAEEALSQNIYDIIKVEYRNEKLDTIYEKLYKIALGIAKRKKTLYQTTTNGVVSDNFRIIYDELKVVFPDSQYKEYKAYESSNVNTSYKSKYVKKVARKSQTFFYDGVGNSMFDRVIDSGNPKVGLQYVFSISLQYVLER